MQTIRQILPALFTFLLASALPLSAMDFGPVGWGKNDYGQVTTPAGLSGVNTISGGDYHSLALKNDGTVVAWGMSDYGTSTVPAGLSQVSAISAGGLHSVALKTDGTVVAWGSNDQGQTTVPAGLSNVIAVTAGSQFSAAVKSDGTVVAWGTNDYGQTTVPAGLSGVTAVEAGYFHMVALKSDGTVAAWGRNDGGQTSVPAGLSNVSAVATGGYHSVALKNDGTVVAWGGNLTGLALATVPAGLSGVIAIDAGTFHTVALKSDGTVVAWGYSEVVARLSGLRGVAKIAAGNVHTLVLKTDGTVVAFGPGFYDYGQSTVPDAFDRVSAVAAGRQHTVALKTNGTVAAWGRNDQGQTTVPAGLSNVSAVAVGGDHSVALKTDRSVVAWGRNDFGQTTVPAGLSSVSAVAAGGDHSVALKTDRSVAAWGRNDFGQTTVPAGLSNVSAVAAGGDHSVALKVDGTVAAWGRNDQGQTTVPTGLSGIIAIAAGSRHSLALKADGTAVAWGNNSYGQTTVPVGLSGIIAIAAGEDHSVALKNDGTVVAWGNNSNGQTTVPVGLKGVGAIAAGYGFTVALVNRSQAITFASIPDKLTTESVNLAATGGGSNNPVTFVVASGPGVITNNVLTFTTSGSVTIMASQAGDTYYSAAEDISRTFTVNKAEASILLTQLNHMANGTPRPVSVSTTPPNISVDISYMGSSTAPSLTGAYEVIATVRDPIYKGTISATLTVLGLTGLEQPILSSSTTPEFNNGTDYGNVTLGRVMTRVFTLFNPGSQPVQLSGNPLVEVEGDHTGDFKVNVLPNAIIPAGGSTSFEIRFAPIQPGIREALVKMASTDLTNGPASFVVQGFGSLPAPRAQTLTFAPPATVYLSQSPLELTATASSGMPVSLQVISGPATLGSNGVLNLDTAGTVKVEARQTGNGSFAAAPALLRTITVKADPTTLTLVDLIKTYNGEAHQVGIVSADASEVVVTYRVGTLYSEELPVNAGQYPVKAVAGSVTKTGTLIINPAPIYVTAENKRRLVGEDNPALSVLSEGFIGVDNLKSILTKPISLSTTATKTSSAGSYAITSSGGAVKTNYKLVHRPGTLVVEGVSGSYEVLLKQPGSGLSNGHLALTVPAASRTFTASLRLGQESAAISWSGSLTLSNESRLATATLSKTVSGVVYELRVTLSMFGEMNCEVRRTDELVAAAYDGIRLLTLPTGRKSVQEGSYTAILEPTWEGVPAGAGWATAKVDASGKMTLIGKLADGTAFTAGLAADVAGRPGYRLFVQPYASMRKDSHFGGSFTLAPHPRLAGKSYVAGSNLTWVKVGQLKDLGYRSGFGPVTSTLRIDPWQAPTTTNRLAARLELGVDGRWLVEHSFTGSLLHDALPMLLRVSATNVVNVVSPLANTRKWKMTITPTTGAYTGSFELLDLTELRKVNFSGVLRQTPTLTDDLIGAGHYLLPALKAAPSTEQTSGAMLFWRPE